MNLKYISWEAEGLLCLGAERMGPSYYQRAEGPLNAVPDIAFVGDEAYWQYLQKVQAFPDEIVVQEKSGVVFKYIGLPTARVSQVG